MISSCGVLHVGGPELVYECAREALTAARAAGVTTTADLVIPLPSMLGDAMGELLPLIDVLQLNLAQAQDCSARRTSSARPTPPSMPASTRS